MTYNTANGSFVGNSILPRDGMDVVLKAIGDEEVNGISRPIDLLVLQEQDEPTTTTQAFVELLNNIYDPSVASYARSSVVSGPAGSNLRQAVVYNTQSVSLLGQIAFGATNSSGATRQPTRFQFRPVGYDSSAEFYVYNNHYKPGTSLENQSRRNVEAQAVRANSDLLADSTHIIYAGDFNIRSSIESMYQTLLAPGNGQAFDPISALGVWNLNSNYAALHTQSPHDGSDGLISSGMDDRFDFQLVSAELLDAEGLSYIPGSYRAFGNDGVSFQQAINNTLVDRSHSASVLNSLAHVSDHLPVVADYQLPAIMGVHVEEIPITVELGETVNIDVTIENVANVVSALGADELDYTLTVEGDLTGAAVGTTQALSGGDTYQVALDTSGIGPKSGILTVTSSSQSAAGSMFTLPITFEVLPTFLEADFNEDGSVNKDDLDIWEAGFGTINATHTDGDANSDQIVSGLDFLVWQRQNGSESEISVSSNSVPEPRAALLISWGACFLLVRQRLLVSRHVY